MEIKMDDSKEFTDPEVERHYLIEQIRAKGVFTGIHLTVCPVKEALPELRDLLVEADKIEATREIASS